MFRFIFIVFIQFLLKRDFYQLILGKFLIGNADNTLGFL